MSTADTLLSSHLIRLRWAVPLLLSALMGATAVLIIAVNQAHTEHSVRLLVTQNMRQVADRVMDKTAAHLAPADTVLALHVGILGARGATPERLEELFGGVSYDVLDRYPQLTSVFYGDVAGNFWSTERDGRGELRRERIERLDPSPACESAITHARTHLSGASSEARSRIVASLAPCLRARWFRRDGAGEAPAGDDEAETYDPRVRVWFREALAAKHTVWTQPYVFFTERVLGITVAHVVEHEGRVAGVAGVNIRLADISDFIGAIDVGIESRTLVVDRELQLVAVPPLPPSERPGGTEARARPEDRDALAALRLELSRVSSAPAFSFVSGGRPFLATHRGPPPGQAWALTTLVVVPESALLDEVQRGRAQSLAVSLLALVVSVLVGLLLSRTITRPVRELSDAMEQVRRFDLGGREIPTAFFELHQMSAAFERMRAGLRSFRKFVPTDLVRQLVESGEEAQLGGEQRELTILFADIVAFTTLSEQLEPNRLVAYLGEYFRDMTAIVEEHHGTVDKYIGDNVMAFWNAPRRNHTHAFDACAAALACQQRLAELNASFCERGMPPVAARIGVHTGTVVVGNMGSPTRLNYTAIGDPVNVASRTEGLCKFYGVPILISRECRHHAGERLMARLVDHVRVKGKSRGVEVFEPLGIAGEVDEATQSWALTYDSALELYLERRWDEAAALFAEVDQERPDGDPPSRIFIERCRAYTEQPPSDDWDGVFVMVSK